jgi:hypothetical protein
MNDAAGRLVTSAWIGLGLAGLFLYPLAVALDGNVFYLQWQRSHSAEAAAAFAILTAIGSAAAFACWFDRRRGPTLILLLIALVPLMAFGGGVSRQLPIGHSLQKLWEIRALRLGVPGVLAVVAALTCWRMPLVFARALRGIVLAVSPVWVLTAWTIIAASRHSAQPLAVERDFPLEPQAAKTEPKATRRCTSLVALLFDEMSFSYLYGADGEVRPEFPEIRRFASTATNFVNVQAPGPETLVSIPGFLAGRRFRDVTVVGDRLSVRREDGTPEAFDARESSGLFRLARDLGLSPEVSGYYFPYCQLLEPLVDICRSFSFYNISTVESGFSPVHPLLTSVILWPRQFPLGLVKNPAFARLQAGLVSNAEKFAHRPLVPGRPVFRFVHFSIPHLPFVFSENGYHRPFDPLLTHPDDQYLGQLRYVDRLVGSLMQHWRTSGSFDRTRLLLFSDHGFRFGGRERDALQIPFVLKDAYQRQRVDVSEPKQGERLLRQVVQNSCQQVE